MSTTRSTDFYSLVSPQLPEFYQIPGVPFIDQTTDYCGPATLTMAMRWAGQNVSVESVAAQVFTPGMSGSLPENLVGTSRRQGLMAVPVHSFSALLTEVAAGHPVIVFANLGFRWAPVWHYALILGYDLKKKEMIMHSGHEEFHRESMRRFEHTWMLADNWGLVVLPAGELAVSADELRHVSAAVGLELTQKTESAEKSYRGILKKWPTSLVALIGLANITYRKGHRHEAIALLRNALLYHPESKAAQHNLAVAEFQ